VTTASASAVPDVPPLAEAATRDQEGDPTDNAFVARRHAPGRIVDLLNRETWRIIALPDVRRDLRTIGFERSADAEEFARASGSRSALARIIREANIKVADAEHEARTYLRCAYA